MAKRKIKRRAVSKRGAAKTKIPGTKTSLTIGSGAFLAILIISALSALYPATGTLGLAVILILAILGALIAIENIKKNEEIKYMISVTCLVVVIISFTAIALIGTLLPQEVGTFLAGILVAFGISGFIVALGTILKLGWD